MAASKNAKIQISKDGPYLVSGNIPLVREEAMRGADGIPHAWKKVADLPEQEHYALCRCGGSKNPPYCDGAHLAIHFDGTETADREAYQEMSKLIEGPSVDLEDTVELCVGAQFCHRAGGIKKLVVGSGEPSNRDLSVEVAGLCPAGRLVVCEKDGEAIEPAFEKLISVTEDPGREVSGPLWVKGGIPLEGADGRPYVKRNRVPLCRCGESHKKPYCDGTHVSISFQEGKKNRTR